MASNKLYRIFSVNRQKYVSVHRPDNARLSRKSTWGRWPTQAIATLSADDESIQIHSFELQQVETLSTDRKPLT